MQLTPSGELYYIDFNNTSPNWAKINNTLWGLPSSTQIATNTAAATVGNPLNTPASGSASKNGNSGSTNGAKSDYGLVDLWSTVVLGLVGAGLGVLVL